MARHPMDVPLSDDHLIALGRVVANWAFFEQAMDIRLRMLLNRQEAAHLPNNLRIEFKRRIRLWRDLAAIFHTPPDEDKKIVRIISRAAQLRDERDWIVHGFWDQRGTMFKFEQGKSETFMQLRPMSLTRVKTVGSKIAQLIHDHAAFYQNYSDRLMAEFHRPSGGK